MLIGLVVAGCGDMKLTASSSCRDFRRLDDRAQDAAIARVAHTENVRGVARNPLALTIVRDACGRDESSSLGYAVKATADSIAAGSSSATAAPTPRTINHASVERGLTKMIVDQIGTQVRRVACPSGEAFTQGTEFDCKVTGADGTTGTVHVTETDNNGHYAARAPFVHPRQIEQIIAPGLQGETRQNHVKVKCPQIIVASKGGTFNCHATLGSKKATVKVTQADDEGHIAYRLQQ